MGMLFATGLCGVERSDVQSLVWYSLATVYGDDLHAQMALAWKYALGLSALKRSCYAAGMLFQVCS